jgi:hypothetical protein
MDRLCRVSRKNVASSSSSSVIVDFQCFKDNNNDYLLKEVCVLEADSGTLLMHHIVKSPFDRDFLSEEKLRESHWLTKHCHGLEWDQGDIWYHMLEDKLRACLAKRSIVYVKGDQKKLYLQRHFIKDTCTTNVIDFNDIGCGSLLSINNLLSTTALRCRHHKSIHTRCALSNCVTLRGWLHLSGDIEDTSSCFCFTTATATEGIDTVE